MMLMLRLVTLLFLTRFIPYNVNARTLQQGDSIWDYTEVPYGTESNLQVMNIALPPSSSSEYYGVMMYHHAKGSTYNSFGQRDVNSALDSGYAFVSWESVGRAVNERVDINTTWSYAQTCFDFLRENADEYGWDKNNIIVGGRSMGSIVSWQLMHSQHPAIVGIYTYNALPEQVWAQPDVWYPPDNVVSPVPPTYMVYGPGPESMDGHNPTNAYPVRDKYSELGEADKLTFIEGMWDNPELYDSNRWISRYGTFHYVPDLVAKIESGTNPPIITATASPIEVSTPSPTSIFVPVPTDVVIVHPYEPFQQGANGLFIGHSFFMPIARQFDDYVTLTQSQQARFFPNHMFTEEFSGGPSGSPGPLWDDIGHFTSINKTLSSGTIDLFGMTSFDGDEDQDLQAMVDTFLETGEYQNNATEYIPDYTRWIDLALSYNPETSIFLGYHWTTYNHLYTAEQFQTYNEIVCNYFFTEIVIKLRQKYPETQVLYICYGPIASTMRQMFEDGDLPDIKNQIGFKDNSLFTDGDRGHAGTMMKDMMAMVWLLILYDPPAQLLNQYINGRTPYNKTNVNDIITEALEFNEGYNLKEEEIMPTTGTTNAPTSLPPTNAPTTMQPSQQPSIAISSSPSMAPTTNSSSTPIIGICFPSAAKVQVLRENQKAITIPMEQLQINDRVLTTTEKYERVYSFGHYDPNLSSVPYLKFLPSGLELSANHYVYRATATTTLGKPVPAREIKVGDELFLTERKREKVTGIQHVYRRGALAPLTTSGKIAVNGVLASTYANDFEIPSWIQNQFHDWAHFVTVILRFNSLWEQQYYTTEGLSNSTDRLRKTTIWFFQRSNIVQILLAVCLLPTLGLMYSLEQMYVSSVSSWLFVTGAIILFYYKMTKKLEKK